MDIMNQVSQTAMLIASLRALACYEEDPGIRGNDGMAELFLPDEKRIPLRTAEYRPILKKAIPQGLYEYVIARTRYFDELFSYHLNRQIPQIVLLGAGYDSRAYRYAGQIAGTTIFEVDTAATQRAKRQILKENAIEIHPNTLYVSADFEQEGWFQGLYGAGYKSTLQTLYLWEGVTFYLSPKAVEAMLVVLKNNSLPGSVLSFDYQHQDKDHPLIDTGLPAESITFGLNARECERYLQRFGYSVIEKVDSAILNARYLTMSDGKRFGEVKSIMNIVTAQVRSS